MNNLAKRIELISNLAIIIVACLLGAVLVKNYLLGGAIGKSVKETTARAPISNGGLTGAKLSMPDVDWAKNGRTLVMVLQSGCHFCTESAPFYQRLAQQRSQQGNIQLVAVLPQKIDDGKKYLDKLGVAVDEVRQASLNSIQVSGTPTLLLVDKSGAVTETWVGKLDSNRETEVLTRLAQ